MISDNSCNKVFFSRHIQRFKCWFNLKNALELYNVEYSFLDETNDIWARDFMPIQLEKDFFISYCNNPDYLQSFQEYITDNTTACRNLNIHKIVKINILLDGGNFIKCGNKVILTDKILQENSSIKPRLLIKEIESIFGLEVILIPWDKDEPYGHADGMVRYVESNHILINHYRDYNMPFRKKLFKALEPHFDEISELSYDKKARVNSWSHLNFLRMGNTIFVPQCGIASEDIAINQLSNIYSDCHIVPVEVKGIIKKGGALNCISWNICQ